MWSSLRFVFFQLTIITIIISVNGLSLHHHARKNQVLPVPPITVINGPVPPPNPFPFPTLPGQSLSPSPTSPPTIHPQCDIICPYDPKCQKMPFQPPPNGQSYCACACQVCNGQYYGPTNNYQNAQPLKALQIQNCPNFVYGNA